MPQLHNPRLAKSIRCYTIAETSELYGVHRQTVRHWLANGLCPIDAGKPIMIHGTALNGFHADRRTKSRNPCGPGEVYCFRCRTPRRPAGDMADLTPITAKLGKITAICPDCDGMLAQHVGPARLALFEAELDVRVRPPREPLEESPQCSPTCHFSEGNTP